MFKEAADAKEPDAIFYLAYFKLKEASKQDSEKEYQEANDMLRRVLVEDNDHSDALYYLGFLYENGLGTDRDLKTSMRYYHKAVHSSGEQNAKAMYKLGNLLYSGEGGVVNKGRISIMYTNKCREGSLLIFQSSRTRRQRCIILNGSTP